MWRPPLALPARVGAGVRGPLHPSHITVEPTCGLADHGRGEKAARTQVEAAAWCPQGVPTSGTGQVAFSPLCVASSWQPAGVPELEDRPRPLLVWGSSILV